MEEKENVEQKHFEREIYGIATESAQKQILKI